MSESYALGNSAQLTPKQEKVFEASMSPSWTRASRTHDEHPLNTDDQPKDKSFVKKLTRKLKAILH